MTQRNEPQYLEVLLVEDNPGDVKLIEVLIQQIRDFPINLRKAASMAEAEKLVETFHLNAILLDLGLPDSVGVSSVQRMVQLAEDIPVIVLTGLVDEKAVAKALDFGAQDYVSKDRLTPELLRKTLLYAVKQRNLLSQMIRDQHKLQQATQVKDEFLAVVSHELRTPLTSIIGYLKIIKMQCVEHMSDEQKDYFAVILRNADTLLTHINTLLDFSKIDQHTSRPKLRILRAFFEVENALKTIGVEAVSGKHPITIDPESQSMDIPIHADPKMLEQVLVNLITNSLRYSPPEKPVEVGSRKETWAGRDGVLLWVKNEGECIPDGLKERIFDKFYQAETHLTRQSHGLGLGLAIVKSIMQLHEGSAWVENLEPTGTRFCVFFPYQDDLEKG